MDLWIAHQFPYADWVQLRPSSFESEPLGLNYEYPTTLYIPASIHAPQPAPKFSTFSLARALTLLNTAPTIKSDSDMDMSPTSDMFNSHMGSSQSSSLPSHTTSPLEEAQLLFELDDLAPATRSLPYEPSASQTQNVLYQQLSSPSSPHSSSPHSSIISSSTVCFQQPQYTGGWEAGAIATANYLHASSNSLIVMEDPSPLLSCFPPSPRKDTVIEIPALRRHHRPLRSSPRRSRSRSSTPGKPKSQPTSPDHSTLLSLPRKRSKKLLRDKDGKPILACLFCRGRKIACGPPPTGSDDPTCNQCARRGLICNYPTESRRGMRTHKKKITDDAPCASSSSPCRARTSKATSDNSDSEGDGDDH
ncbi:hypothetical protein H0H87_008744 [Tephrocybe sp. NHM501043]|nr:hypothetical protein H0H87_008744 [Tephrocybe sp. NHM501043]